MNITFPADKLEDKKFDFRSKFGNFLIGDDNTWHGGIHIEGKDTAIKTIADGRIIAYRFEEGYKEIIKNEGADTEHICKYSNCFIIIQHDFELVKHIIKNKGKEDETKEKKAENVTFYSLYNHLLPLDELQNDTSGSIEIPDFMSTPKTQVTATEVMKGLEAYPVKDKNKRDTANLVFIPHGDQFELATDKVEDIPNKIKFNDRNSTYIRIKYKNHHNIYINPRSSLKEKVSANTYRVKTQIDTKDKDVKGARVREASNSKSKILKIITKGTTVEIDQEKSSGSWLKLKDQEGYVYKKSVKVKNILDTSKFETNSITTCDIPVKSGKKIGYTGLKQSKSEDNYYVCHHEIFMDDENLVNEFLENQFDQYSEEEKPLDKKKYYKLPKGVTLYKPLKVPDNSTLKLKAKTPVKVIGRKDKFCKVKILDKVERTVEKVALAVKKPKGEKIVYDIVNFDYISKIFDGIISKGDTLTHVSEVKNTLVKVSYEKENKSIDYDFWIPYSDLSKNYEFEEKSKPIKVYKSVKNAESITDYVMAPKSEPIDNVRVHLNFIRDIKSNDNDEDKEPEEVGRKNVTKTTYIREIEKKVSGVVERSLMKTTNGELIKWTKNDSKEPKHHYPVNPKKTPKFNEINAAFNGKLNLTEVSRLFSNGSFYCNKNGIKGDKSSLYRGLTYIYKEKEEAPIVPNIIHEDENVIQAILPVEVYKKFEISETNYEILPIDNTGQDPKVHEDVDTLFAFFENKLPNVSGFELKWKEACNEQGERVRPITNATHRLVEFNIEEFNKKQNVQSHQLLGGFTPKVGDEVGLVKDVTDIWMARPENKEDVDYTLQKETIVKLTGAKDIVIGEEQGDFHYRQVETHNLYLGNDSETIHKGWVKIDNFEEKKFFSPYNWDQFGFTILDGGDEYIYEIKDTLDHTKTKSNFIKKIWENFNIDNDHLINAEEVRVAMGLNEVRYEMSRVVAKHKSEWSYNYNQIKADVEKFYNAQINFAKENKREQSVIDQMENQKQTYLSSLNTQVTDLMFWDDASKPYTSTRPEAEPVLLKPKPVKLDFGITDDDRAINEEPIIPVATTTEPTATLPKPAKTKTAETKKDKPTTPERAFPASPEVYHFHPLAFINQMKLMFGEQMSDCPELVWGKKVSCEFRKRVVQISKRLECDPNHLMAAMALETGGKFDPKIDNGKAKDKDGIGYIGLIQIGNAAITEMNKNYFLHTAKIKKINLKAMTAVEQLCYVEYYLTKHKGKLKTLADFYLAILWPDAVGHGTEPNYIVFDDDAIGDKKKAYHSNPTFHREKDEYKKNSKGVIYERNGKAGGKTYVWEIAEAIQEWYDKGVPETNTESNCTCNSNCSCSKGCVDLTGKITWITQFNKSERKNGVMKTDGCWRTSQKLLISAGLGKTSGYKKGMLTTAKENDDNTAINLTVDAKAGVEYIDKELEKGNPVLVGLDHTLNYRHNGKLINDGTTDHYVTIVGRGCENDKVFYRFYEVGTSWAHYGQHSSNKLFLGEDFSLKGTPAHNKGKKYTVSQVRKN